MSVQGVIRFLRIEMTGGGGVVPPSILVKYQYLRIFLRFFRYTVKDFRMVEPVEIPRKQVPFLCKGLSMEEKVTKNQFS